MGDATPQRGGRAKRMVRVTAKGVAAAKELFDAVRRVSRGVAWEVNRSGSFSCGYLAELAFAQDQDRSCAVFEFCNCHSMAPDQNCRDFRRVIHFLQPDDLWGAPWTSASRTKSASAVTMVKFSSFGNSPDGLVGSLT